MFAFIRKHWIAYLVGAGIAVALGFGVSYVLGIKWSTPEDVRAERQEAYAEDAAEREQLAGDESQSVDDASAEDQAAGDQSVDNQPVDDGAAEE